MDNIPEITIDIKSVSVSVTPRKLRARWTPAMNEDYGIPAQVHKRLRKAGLKTRFKYQKEASMVIPSFEQDFR